MLQNYAQSPIPQVPVSQFNVRGGLTFAGVGGRRGISGIPARRSSCRESASPTRSLPRRFCAAATESTTNRSGVTNVQVNQTGFNSSTNFVGTLDNGQTYVANLTNPFPGGFYARAGRGRVRPRSSARISASSTRTYEPVHAALAVRGAAAVAWKVPSRDCPTSEIAAPAAGDPGSRPIPRQYFSTLPVRDQATINLLNSQVANPFYPLLPRTNLASTTVALSQLLRPNPQFTGITASMNSGFSWYHALQVRTRSASRAGLPPSTPLPGRSSCRPSRT